MIKYAALLILVFISLRLHAQSDDHNLELNDHTILTALVSKKWKGSGVLMGKPATFTMDWQYVLDNQFIKLKFQNTRKSGDDENIVFKAAAFYKIANDSTVVGNWFDNRGMAFPLKGQISQNEMTIYWGNDETEKGKTIYRYISDNNEIGVEDFIMNNGEYHKFGNATYSTKD